MRNWCLLGALTIAWLPFQKAVAQLPDLKTSNLAGNPGTDLVVLARLLTNHPAFVATAEMRNYDTDHKETLGASMSFAYLDGKIRTELDTSRLRGKTAGLLAGEHVKQMGLDQNINLIRPDEDLSYVIFPKLKTLLKQPLSKTPGGITASTPFTVETIGKDSLDGHPCEKKKVTFTLENDRKESHTVWYATDLKNFPIQILTEQKEGTMITRFKAIQFTQPDAELFKPPPGFKEHADMRSFLQGVLTQILNNNALETE